LNELLKRLARSSKIYLLAKVYLKETPKKPPVFQAFTLFIALK